MKRLELVIVGTVQGVGFRPFVHREASARGLAGSVRNTPRGVAIDVQGEAAALDDFVAAVVRGPREARSTVVPGAASASTNGSPKTSVPAASTPAAIDAFVAAIPRVGETARVERCSARPIDLALAGFTIAASEPTGDAPRASLPPDLAPCAACADEVARPGRRHRYPFTSCTSCGPRGSIAISAPWDRAATTMARFPPCEACAAEYGDPEDRRCHAQTIACPACGPRLWLERSGTDGPTTIAEGDAALGAAIDALRAGRIVALQGVGGWQLLVDATAEHAVAELRRRKRREARPFAVLFADLAAVERACILEPAERDALCDPAAPIVLVRTPQTTLAPFRPTGAMPTSLGDPMLALSVAPSVRSAGAMMPPSHADPMIAPSVAPGSRLTGAMLPASPLHALLARGVGRPLVCTSGNLAEEPLCIEPDDARRRLAMIADLWLGNDRPIARPLDDSVVRVTRHGRTLIRRARGFAPRPLPRRERGPITLALGAHMKTTIALATRDQIWLSAHIGDLGSPEAIDRHEHTVRELLAEAGVRPDVIACDLHPELASTALAERLARETGAALARIPHHAAHVAAVAAEHAIDGPVLGLAWDGMGLGEDGTLWGGEAIVLDGARAERIAHLRPFPLPGGEAAIREPRRAALGLCSAGELPRAMAEAWFHAGELAVIDTALARRINAPLTTSIGRLFDAIAALIGLRGVSRFEADAAMALEQAALDEPNDVAPYPIEVGTWSPYVIDWRPTIAAILDDVARRDATTIATIAARFHATLAEAAVGIATRAGIATVALAGGCFQNARLRDAVTDRLQGAGFAVVAPRELPFGDGGLAVGQALLAARRTHVSRDSR